MAHDDQLQETPVGSEQQIEAVRESAERAGRELDQEQEETVTSLVQALSEIDEGEALAQLDSRLSFVERQVGRVAARREEAGRAIQGELSIMRARVEDALRALGATAEEQRESWALIEKRLVAMISEAEQRAESVVETLRGEVVSKVEEASSTLEGFESRMRGELSAFEEETRERVRTQAESTSEYLQQIENKGDELEAFVRKNSDETQRAVTEARTDTQQQVTKAVADLEERLEEANSQLEQALDRTTGRLEDRLGETWGSIDVRVEEALRSGQELLEKATGMEQSLLEKLGEGLQSSRAEIERVLQGERREVEGRLSEFQAEVRMEGQRLRDALDARSQQFDETVETLKGELLQRITAGENKTAEASVRLESMIRQQQRQMASDEGEWTAALSEIREDVSGASVRLEELLGKVTGLEARSTADRGSSRVALESLSTRMEALEERVRAAVETIAARQGTRLEMLSSQVAKLSELEAREEERAGAVNYLARRAAEIGERLDEVLLKVNAIGRAVTKQLGTSRPVEGRTSSELAKRLQAIEDSLAELAGEPAAPAVERRGKV
jgi:tetrahydromethanopterin S-methyltransferase subunit G